MKRVIFALVAAMALPAMAQTTAPARVAVINVQKVLADSTRGKVAYERLQKLQDEKAGRAQKMDDELKSIDSQINEKKMSLSDEKVVELRKQFDEKKIAFQRYAQDADRDLTAERDRALAELEKQLMPIINQVGKEMGFAVIFNKYESGLVYASDAIDISDVVVKRFNESSPSAAPAVKK